MIMQSAAAAAAAVQAADFPLKSIQGPNLFCRSQSEEKMVISAAASIQKVDSTNNCFELGQKL